MDMSQRIEDSKIVQCVMAGSSANPSARKTVLVVEDDGGLAKLLRFVLESAGLVVTMADSAADAMARDFTDYDAVLLDIHLPDAHGEDVAEQLRVAGYARPIVALTADARLVESGKVADSVNSPFDGWIDKAVPPDQLLSQILVYLDDGGGPR